ncbi:unnamed protein product [Ixodes pacificus]
MWLNTNRTCPLCRANVQAASLVPAHPLIQNMVGNVKVKCRSPGCSARVAVSLYTTHLGVCEFKEVPCPHDLCERRCPRRTLQDHVKTCPHRMLTCQLGCGAEVSAGELENHGCMLKLRLQETTASLEKWKQEAGERSQLVKCLDNTLAEMKLERDGWKRKADDAVRTLQSVCRDLEQTVVDNDGWKRKAEDASRTLKTVCRDLRKPPAYTDTDAGSWKYGVLLGNSAVIFIIVEIVIFVWKCSNLLGNTTLVTLIIMGIVLIL